MYKKAVSKDQKLVENKLDVEVKKEGFHDEEKNEWECEDSCLDKKDSQVCGETDHL